MAGKTKNICLIGPRGAGKSALMASLVHAVERRLHGFAPDRTFSISGWSPDRSWTTNPLDEFAAGLRPGKQKDLELLFLGQGEFSASENPTDDDPPASAPPAKTGFGSTQLETLVYSFQIDSVPCRVVDTGGELLSMTASGAPYTDLRAAKPRDDVVLKFDEFINQLRQCDSLVLTFPLLELDEALWAPRVNMILNSLMGLSKPPQLERIIVAWTHYDVLLAPFGPFAATLACNPDRGKKAIRLALSKYTQINTLLDGLQRRLTPANSGSPFPIHHIPVSSHGFISRNGASLVHLNKAFEHYLDTQKSVRREALQDFWRPFLSADPILGAAFGTDNHPFFFAHPIDPAESNERAGLGPGFWSRLKESFRRLFSVSTQAG